MPAPEEMVVVIGESLVDIISDPRQPEAVKVHPGGSPLNVAVGAARLGLVALTRGASGPVILSRRGRVERAAGPNIVADTVGAGDSFMAGLLSGPSQLGTLRTGGRRRMEDLTPEELQAVAPYANRAAAVTCSRQGANPPRKDDLGPLIMPTTSSI